jgi:hypothetical protein
MDQDQSGNAFQQTRVTLGPSPGPTNVQIQPAIILTAPGVYTLSVGTSLVLVNVTGAISFVLPDVVAWQRQPGAAFERAIWIKDLGGHAGSFPITVFPFATQVIDKQPTYTISTNFAIARIYPIFDLSGWFVM